MPRKIQQPSLRSRKVFVCLGFMSSILSGPAFGIEFKGNTRIGYYTRQVEFQGDYLKETAGETNNDEQVLSAELRANLEDIDESKDRFLVDFRNKRDNFGRLERENLRLSAYDRRQLRVAAFQRPWENNRVYFTVGRFTLPEANILANDGAEVGYRSSKSTRYGLFAGQGAKDIIAPLYVDPDTREVPATQAGLYYNYEVKDGPEDSSYLTNALAQAPSYDITDSQSHLYYYQQGMWTMNNVHRFGSLVHFDFAPKTSLRRGYVSYFYQTDRLRTGGYFQQTSTEDYLIKQTLQDNLAPSTVRSLDLSARYRVTANFSVEAGAERGSRSSDGLTRTEYSAGLLFPRILGDTSSTRLQLGVRQNFLSKDKFTKIAYDYWGKTLSVGLSHTITDETYDDDTKNKRSVTTVDAGVFVLDDIRGSLGYEVESDSKVNAKALFVMVGYRFGSMASSPRTKPARFEEL